MRARLGLSASQLKGHYRKGGVFAYATESVFGLGGDPRKPLLLKRILRLKRRPQKKGMIVLAADLAQLRPLLAPLSKTDESRLQEYWPGPVTLLLPASRKALPLLRGKHKTLAVRVTDHPQAAALCRLLGPLVSTSANLAGQPSIRTARGCIRRFGSHVLTVPGRVGRRRKPSTIIDFKTGRRLR